MIKAKQRCADCDASLTLCMCAVMPRLDLRTRVVLVVHFRELRRSSNTGLLAHRALINSSVVVRGETRTPLDLQAQLNPAFRTLLYYPARDAVELDHVLVEQDPRPIQLIVPDGTWRQARKLNVRQRELAGVARVKISAPNNSLFQLRAQARPERMATLQAVAAALGVIEGDEVREQLMQLYNQRVLRTLNARGQLPKVFNRLAPAAVE